MKTVRIFARTISAVLLAITALARPTAAEPRENGGDAASALDTPSVATCGVDVAKTGQTQCWNVNGSVIPCAGTGQDGELQRGVAPVFTDNGDGTITDNRTLLMWEKLSADMSIHDRFNLYSWENAFALKVAALNSAGGFAGHRDWRVPNRNELASLVDLAAGLGMPGAFDTGCTPGCTVLVCSCAGGMWTSTTLDGYTPYAFAQNFPIGNSETWEKSRELPVRAVRDAF